MAFCKHAYSEDQGQPAMFTVRTLRVWCIDNMLLSLNLGEQ